MRFKIYSVIPCIYKRDYSMGGNNGSLISNLVAWPLSLSLCLFVCLSLCHFCHLCNFCPFCHFGEGRGEKGRGVTYIQTDIQIYIHTEPPTKRVLEEHSLLKRRNKRLTSEVNAIRLYKPR